MSVHCAVCGHPLAAADMACPTCLPNFYKSKADKLLRGEGYPPATDFTNMTTEPSDIVERLESALAHFVASEVEGMTSYTSEMLREAAAEITRLRAALADIAHGNWSSPAIDSPAANTYAIIVAEMRKRATAAIRGNE